MLLPLRPPRRRVALSRAHVYPTARPLHCFSLPLSEPRPPKGELNAAREQLRAARTEHACELARLGAHHDATLRPLRERLAAAEARAARYEGDGAAEKDALALLERGRRVGAAHRIQVGAEGLFRIFFEFSRHR